MKSLSSLAGAILATTLVLGLVGSVTPRPVNAQVANGNIILLYVGAPSACAWPSSAATITNGMALCGTTSGLYFAINGGTFSPVAPAASSGVFPANTPATSGTCITGYNSATGVFSIGPCLATLTKAAVLGTGIAAVTNSTTSLQ